MGIFKPPTKPMTTAVAENILFSDTNDSPEKAQLKPTSTPRHHLVTIKRGIITFISDSPIADEVIAQKRKEGWETGVEVLAIDPSLVPFIRQGHPSSLLLT